MAAEKYKVTRIYNKTSSSLPVGFLGRNGWTIAANSYYDHYGDLEDSLTEKEEQALQDMLVAGQIDILKIPGSSTDGVWSPQVTLQKSISTTGPGTSAMYNASLPAKLKIIGGHVVMTSVKSPAHKLPTTKVSVTDGTNAILKKLDIGPTAAGDTDIVRFAEIDDSKQTLSTGASLIVAVTGSTGMPKFDVYVTAIRVE